MLLNSLENYRKLSPGACLASSSQERRVWRWDADVRALGTSSAAAPCEWWTICPWNHIRQHKSSSLLLPNAIISMQLCLPQPAQSQTQYLFSYWDLPALVTIEKLNYIGVWFLAANSCYLVGGIIAKITKMAEFKVLGVAMAVVVGVLTLGLAQQINTFIFIWCL